MSGSQNTLLKAKGLSSFPNPLSAVPEGSFADVSNVVVDRNEIIEPRRGYAQYGNSFGSGSDRTKQLFSYKDSVLRHVLSEIQFDIGGNFTSFAGPNISELNTGVRIRSIEANGNFYFVSSTGIKKISARNSSDFTNIAIQEAGGVKALDLIATPDYTTAGFLSANSKCAYRILWGTKDLNENLILGVPSPRSVVFNRSTTDSCITNLKFSIPVDALSENYFYQVYRTAVFSGAITPSVVDPVDPGDEMYLVFEDNVTAADILAGEITVSDITPEDFRASGTLLYTNPVSGEGIAQSNERPPFAHDIALYKNYTFYANTSTVQRFNLSFLTAQGISNTSNVVISDGISTNTYTFQGSVETYTLDFTGANKVDFHNAVAGTAKYFTLDSANDETKYVIWYYESALDEAPVLPGRIPIKIILTSASTPSDIMNLTETGILDACGDFNISQVGTVMTIVNANNGFVTNAPTETITGTFAISKDGLGKGQDAAAKKIFLPRIPTGGENGPTPSQQLEQIARSMVSVLNQEDNIVYAYYNSGYNDVPGQMIFERQDISGSRFYVTSNIGAKFTPTLPATGSSVGSSNEVSPNRLFYSKFQQPEAVPLANYIDVGPRDREIKRIVPLRDSLFVFKEDGIYRISGETAPFTVAAFDFSAQVLAPDTAVVLNNQIYALSTQGVIVVTDTGVSIISRPIENAILQVTKKGYSYKTSAFGVSYESDRAYLLFLPSIATDNVATQCYRYNTFTNCWTRWDVAATSGIVNFSDDTMYLGAADTNYIEKERKSLTRMDHADREYQLTVLTNQVNGNIIKLNDISRVKVNDVVIQTQYLTQSQFNRCLIKLDADITVADNNYFSTLEFKPGMNIRSSLVDLATKLDADAGIIYTGFSSDIASCTLTITNKVASGTTTTLDITGTNTILPDRWILTDASNVSYKVLTSTPTQIVVDGIIIGAPTVLQTDINDFRDTQACFNIMMGELNTDGGVFYTNYPLSEGSINLESPVLAINTLQNTIQTKTAMSYMFGDIILYKSIPSRVVWNPIFFQDPSLTKQVREGTMIFENSNFSKVDISYSSDLSPAFENITFQGDGLGVGDWGYFNWGTLNWGGVAAPIPLRTLIPLAKQRCRFINAKFEHSVAFEKYAIYGLSLTYRIIGARGYR